MASEKKNLTIRMTAPFPGKPTQAKFGFYGEEMIEKEVIVKYR